MKSSRRKFFLQILEDRSQASEIERSVTPFAALRFEAYLETALRSYSLHLLEEFGSLH
jgi:hypothetical protein